MKSFHGLMLILSLFLLSGSCAKESTSNVNTVATGGEMPDDPTLKQIHMMEQNREAIQWVSITEAEKLSKAKPKKIFIDVYADWCGPCKWMSRETFTDPDVIAYANQHFYAVKFDGEDEADHTFKGKTYSFDGQNNTLSYYLGIQAYPTIVYFDGKDLSPIKKDTGAKGANKFLKALEEIHTEAYKN